MWISKTTHSREVTVKAKWRSTRASIKYVCTLMYLLYCYCVDKFGQWNATLLQCHAITSVALRLCWVYFLLYYPSKTAKCAFGQTEDHCMEENFKSMFTSWTFLFFLTISPLLHCFVLSLYCLFSQSSPPGFAPAGQTQSTFILSR